MCFLLFISLIVGEEIGRTSASRSRRPSSQRIDQGTHDKQDNRYILVIHLLVVMWTSVGVGIRVRVNVVHYRTANQPLDYLMNDTHFPLITDSADLDQ